MKKFMIASIFAATALGAPALAADMPTKMPSAPPASVASWTGCYIGANVGNAWASKNATEQTFAGAPAVNSLGTASGSGLAYGGQVGCDYQLNSSWVIGLRGMWDGLSGVSGNVSAIGAPGTLIFGLSGRSFSTAVGRVGYLLTPQLMFYGLAGVASEDDKYSLAFPVAGSTASLSQTRTGWDAGAGFSWKFDPTWDFWVEYNYLGFGANNLGFMYANGGAANLATNVRVGQSAQSILVGVDYRFTNWLR